MDRAFDHSCNLRCSANLSRALFTLQRNRVPAQNPHNGSMGAIDAERDRRRAALNRFWEQNRTGLKSIRQWATASGVGYNTLNEFVRQKKDKNMLADTYEKLAKGASSLLKREVTLGELLNESIEPADIERANRLARISELISQLPENEQNAFESVLAARVKSLGSS